MAFSIHGSRLSQPFAACTSITIFSSTIGDLISKIIESIRNCFAQIFCGCFKSAREEPTQDQDASESRSSLLNKGSRFLSRNGDAILSKATGINTEHATSAGNYFAGSVDALKKGKFRLAGTAAMAGVSAGVLSVTDRVIPKEVRELNKVSRI